MALFLCRRWLSSPLPTPAVTHVRLKEKEKRLQLKYADGVEHSLTAELLRVETPSAEAGIGSERSVVQGRRHVGMMDVEPVGNYAIRILFDDLHDSGIYSWKYLRELGDNKYNRMKTYLQKLRDIGGTRDPRRRRR